MPVRHVAMLLALAVVGCSTYDVGWLDCQESVTPLGATDVSSAGISGEEAATTFPDWDVR